MTQKVTFRQARRQDVPAIVAMLADDPLGAERDGKVIGTMQLSYLAGLSRLGAERCQIEAVRVAATTRGQGLGRRMIQWAVDRARARGCAMVQLTSDKSRTDAHRFYASLGFTASHEGYKLKLG
jgi:GNAT superfamily N-acetyltransferase